MFSVRWVLFAFGRMDLWLGRFVDEESGGLHRRLCLVSDYLRSLRISGSLSPTLQDTWRRVCNTADPLVSGPRAAAQLRRFLDCVETEVGPIPSDLPQVSFEASVDQDAIDDARRSWAESVMSVTLDLGSNRRRAVSADSGEGRLSSGSNVFPEPLDEPSPEYGQSGGCVVQQSVKTELSDDGAVPAGLVANSEATWNTTRVVRVVSAKKDYGPFEVYTPVGTTGYNVMSQVADHLRAAFAVPPLPRWLFVGPNLAQGVRIDPKDGFEAAVAPDEYATVRCLEPDFGDSEEKICERIRQSSSSIVSGLAEHIVSSEQGVGCTPSLCLSVLREHGVLSSGTMAGIAERVIQVRSSSRDLGACVVVSPDSATPYTIFSQVSAYLGQVHRVPPLPRWLFVGSSLETGMHLELDSLLVDQVLPEEELVVECLEPGLILQGDHTSTVAEPGSRRRKRHRRHARENVDETSGQCAGSGQAPLGSASRRHGWDPIEVRQSGWDVRLPDVSALPGWVGELVAQIGIDLGPYHKSIVVPDIQTAHGLQLGEVGAFLPQGRGALVDLMSRIGSSRETTFHVKLADGGERILEAQAYNHEFALMVVAIAGDAVVSVVSFGSPDESGWLLEVVDKMDTPGGLVVILRVKVNQSRLTSSLGAMRPRTPSRSPRRKDEDKEKPRRVFGQTTRRQSRGSGSRGDDQSGGNRSVGHPYVPPESSSAVLEVADVDGTVKCEGQAQREDGLSSTQFVDVGGAHGGRPVFSCLQVSEQGQPFFPGKLRDSPLVHHEQNHFQGKSSEFGLSPITCGGTRRSTSER